MTSRTEPSQVATSERRRIIDLLNDAMSAEYHSFVGYALSSNPFVTPAMEKDLGVLERIREEENANCRALLAQLGRYRAGPTLKAFWLWREDLNFLGLDYLVIRCADALKKDVARVEKAISELPDDPHMSATFRSILATKKRHAAELGKLAEKRTAERAAIRAQARQYTAVKIKGLDGPAAPQAAPAAGKAAPAGAPRPPGAAPRPPGAAPRPPGAAPPPPGAKQAPAPPGAAPKPPGAAPKPPGAAPKSPGPIPPGRAPKPPGA